MRAYPANQLNFLETVQVYFLEVTGKGVVLGSRDAELLQAWRAEGATAAAVCKGIDDAVRARNELPRSISACRKWIEPRVETARSLKIGDHGDAESPEEPAATSGLSRSAEAWATDALEAIAMAGEATERPEFKEAYRNAYRAIRRALDDSDDIAQTLLEVEERLGQEFFEALSDEERAAFEQSVDEARLHSMGAEARARWESAAIRRYLERTFDLVSVFE